MRAAPLFLSICLLAGGLALSPARATAAEDPVIIAVIDTGIRATHHAFEPGQVVAWYDFSNPTPRRNDTTWDPLVTTPYDPHGHGTGVASMAAGNLPSLTPNFAPGAKLAVARFDPDDTSGQEGEQLIRAILWATEIVHADVITISYGIVVPMVPHTSRDMGKLSALRAARESGVLVTTAAGNGIAHTGVPDPSWSHLTNSPYSLVVGGSTKGGRPVLCAATVCTPVSRGDAGTPPLWSYDPEVTSDFSPRIACRMRDDCVTDGSGTSFSAPRAASLAAALLTFARSQGKDLTPDELEWLIKQTATPHLLTEYAPQVPSATVGEESECYGLSWLKVCTLGPVSTPPVEPAEPLRGTADVPAAPFEGYGDLASDALEKGIAILQGAPGPSGPDWEHRVWYVETVRGTMEAAWMCTVDRGRTTEQQIPAMLGMTPAEC